MNALVRNIAIAGLVLVGLASNAFAQPVQWRVQDGGNGHWYAETAEVLVWPQLRAACEAKGGHLATLTTQAEWSWVKSHFPIPAPEARFVGAYQDHASPDYHEPNGGWKWVTGEPFVLDLAYMGSTNLIGTMTEPGFDDCPGGSVGLCGCGPAGAQDVLIIMSCCNNILDDIGDGIVQNCDSISRRGIIEWDADCNGDGIVDKGQILSGQLADTNGNGVPDICETTPTAAVQWRVQDGGNGHWYEVVRNPAGNTVHWGFSSAQAYAVSRGGHLATFSTASANTAAYNLLSIASRGNFSGWIGLWQDHADPTYSEPGGGWKWVTGAPLTFTFWQPGEPSNAGCNQPSAVQDWGVWEGAQTGGDTSGRWDDSGDPVPACNAPVVDAIIEWDADCNGDGIVDKGQILSGQLADANGNGVPDVCECMAPSVTSPPAAQTVCPGGAGSFSVAAAGTTLSYQWQIEAAPGNWVTLSGTPQPLIFCGPSTPGSAFASQPSSASTSISVLGCHGVQHWSIRAVITNTCGSVNSTPATLTVCPADFNCNGVIEVVDIFAFLNAWFAGSPSADFDGLNGLQVADIFAFLNAWFTGCP